MTDQMTPAENSANSANILKFIIQLLENIPTPILIHNDVVVSINFLKELHHKCELDAVPPPVEEAPPVEPPPPVEEAPPVEPPAPVFTGSELPGEGMAKLAAHQENMKMSIEEARQLAKQRREAQRLEAASARAEREAKKGEKQ